MEWLRREEWMRITKSRIAEVEQTETQLMNPCKKILGVVLKKEVGMTQKNSKNTKAAQ